MNEICIVYILADCNIDTTKLYNMVLRRRRRVIFF